MACPVARCRHRYWVVRHGESAPNVAGVIVSRPERGLLPENGLTAIGRAQAAAAADFLARTLAPAAAAAAPLVYTSDFSRATETAAPIAVALGAAAAVPEPRLRERDFGALEGGSNGAYAAVWTADADDAAHSRFGVESVEAVAARGLAVVADVEAAQATSPARDIVLVAHGDVLQILIAALTGRDLRAHRSLPHLGNGEARRVAPAACGALAAAASPCDAAVADCDA